MYGHLHFKYGNEQCLKKKKFPENHHCLSLISSKVLKDQVCLTLTFQIMLLQFPPQGGLCLSHICPILLEPGQHFSVGHCTLKAKSATHSSCQKEQEKYSY